MPRARTKIDSDPVEESILADPRLDRQLPEYGPLLFWRDAPKAGREGIACITTFCPDPQCGCRDAALQALAVDDRLLAVEVTRGGQIRMPCIAEEEPESRPSRGANCIVDLDTGRITPDEGHQDEALVAWLRGVLDEEVMDLLRLRWSKMKPGLAAPAQPVRVAPSPRRNDPCPCGSGKKFKLCVSTHNSKYAESADMQSNGARSGDGVLVELRIFTPPSTWR